MEIAVLEGQSLFDIALMVSGSAEAAFDLAQENDLSLTDDLIAGQILKFSGTPINKAVAEYCKVNNIKPATAVQGKIKRTGIGYMVIDYDFIVG